MERLKHGVSQAYKMKCPKHKPHYEVSVTPLFLNLLQPLRLSSE